MLGAELPVLHAAFVFDVSDSVLKEIQRRRRQRIEKLIVQKSIPVKRIHIPIGLASMQIEEYARNLSSEVVVMGSVKRGL